MKNKKLKQEVIEDIKERQKIIKQNQGTINYLMCKFKIKDEELK